MQYGGKKNISAHSTLASHSNLTEKKSQRIVDNRLFRNESGNNVDFLGANDEKLKFQRKSNQLKNTAKKAKLTHNNSIITTAKKNFETSHHRQTKKLAETINLNIFAQMKNSSIAKSNLKEGIDYQVLSQMIMSSAQHPSKGLSSPCQKASACVMSHNRIGSSEADNIEDVLQSIKNTHNRKIHGLDSPLLGLSYNHNHNTRRRNIEDGGDKIIFPEFSSSVENNQGHNIISKAANKKEGLSKGKKNLEIECINYDDFEDDLELNQMTPLSDSRKGNEEKKEPKLTVRDPVYKLRTSLNLGSKIFNSDGKCIKTITNNRDNLFMIESPTGTCNNNEEICIISPKGFLKKKIKFSTSHNDIVAIENLRNSGSISISNDNLKDSIGINDNVNNFNSKGNNVNLEYYSPLKIRNANMIYPRGKLSTGNASQAQKEKYIFVNKSKLEKYQKTPMKGKERPINSILNLSSKLKGRASDPLLSNNALNYQYSGHNNPAVNTINQIQPSHQQNLVTNIKSPQNIYKGIRPLSHIQKAKSVTGFDTNVNSGGPISQSNLKRSKTNLIENFLNSKQAHNYLTKQPSSLSTTEIFSTRTRLLYDEGKSKNYYPIISQIQPSKGTSASGVQNNNTNSNSKTNNLLRSRKSSSSSVREPSDEVINFPEDNPVPEHSQYSSAMNTKINPETIYQKKECFQPEDELMYTINPSINGRKTIAGNCDNDFSHNSKIIWRVNSARTNLLSNFKAFDIGCETNNVLKTSMGHFSSDLIGNTSEIENISVSSNGVKCGKITLILSSNYGDKKYIGITGLQFLDDKGEVINIENASSIGALPKDVNTYYNNCGDTRIFENVFNNINDVIDESFMWLTLMNISSPPYLEIAFPKPITLSMIKIWNYNKPGELDKGVRSMELILDDNHSYNSIPSNICNTYRCTLLLRKGVGEENMDYSQIFKLPVSPISFTEQELEPFKHVKFASFLYSQDYETPYLPTGFVFKFLLYSTWGDPNYIGLNGIELYDQLGLPVLKHCNPKVIAIPSAVSELPGMEADIRHVSNLLNGFNSSSLATGKNIWLAPYNNTKKSGGENLDNTFSNFKSSMVNGSSKLNTIYFLFDRPISLSYIQIWNYTKNSRRGVRDIQISCDDNVIYFGALNSPGAVVDRDKKFQGSTSSSCSNTGNSYRGSQAENNSTIILFTCDSQITKAIDESLLTKGNILNRYQSIDLISSKNEDSTFLLQLLRQGEVKEDEKERPFTMEK